MYQTTLNLLEQDWTLQDYLKDFVRKWYPRDYQALIGILPNQNVLRLVFAYANNYNLWELCNADEVPEQFRGAFNAPAESMKVVGNYQYASYQCPYCGECLYKVIFPEGNDPVIDFDLHRDDNQRGSLSPARIFTCFDCLNLYATMKGYKLSDGNVIVASFRHNRFDMNNYNLWIGFFNELGDAWARRKE